MIRSSRDTPRCRREHITGGLDGALPSGVEGGTRRGLRGSVRVAELEARGMGEGLVTVGKARAPLRGATEPDAPVLVLAARCAPSRECW